jgi:hypothetical protein
MNSSLESNEKSIIIDGQTQDQKNFIRKVLSILPENSNKEDSDLIRSLEHSLVVKISSFHILPQGLTAEVSGRLYEMILTTSINSIQDFSVKVLVSHDCIIKVIGFIEYQDQVFYLQEDLPVSLKTSMSSRTLNWKKVFLGLVSAVILLQSKGINSAALDPDMLVFDKTRGAVIKFLDAYHLQKVNYLAPEFIFFKQVNQESNVWTLGCLLVFLVTGEDPFGELMGHEIGVKLLEKETISQMIEKRELKPFREILKSVFKIKQSKRLRIDELFERIQQC